jgi:hypothetical protein
MPASGTTTQRLARLAAAWIAEAGAKPARLVPAGAPRRALAGVVAALVLRPRQA